MEKEYLVGSEEMKSYDKYTIESIGIPALVLMERAALSVVDALKERFCDIRNKKILVVCGGGNNGGDGLAVARLLIDDGYDVDVVLAASRYKCSEATKQQLKILQTYVESCFGENLYVDEQKNLPILELKEYAIIIDALFGVGLSRPINGYYSKWVEAINASKAYVVAVDIPSGIDSDLGRVLGCAIKADLTVTFAFAKRGLYLYPGKEYAGEVDCRQIGITKKSFNNNPPACYTYPQISVKQYQNPEKEMARYLPKRNADGNKGTFGKLLIIAGSKDMCGACLLSAKAAYRVGAGMVKIVTVEENREIIQTSFPEAMLYTYKEGCWQIEELNASIAWADGIVIGPGLGQKETAGKLLETVFREAKCPIVVDADGLNLLASNTNLQLQMQELTIQKFTDRPFVLTPHQGELARLTGKSISELKENPFVYAKELAEKWKCVVVSKDAATIVCDSDKEIYINSVGNSGMATAGSGDVLAGILGGILVQNFARKQERCNSMLECVSKGVFLHACAGDLAREAVGEHAMLAGDLIRSLIEISKERNHDEAVSAGTCENKS